MAWPMKVGDLVKCGHCSWLHFLVKDGEGFDGCFFCSCSGAFMLPGDKSDAPIGATLQPINIRNCRGKSNAYEVESSESVSSCEQSESSSGVREGDKKGQVVAFKGWPPEEIERAGQAFEDQRSKERSENNLIFRDALEEAIVSLYNGDLKVSCTKSDKKVT